MKLKKGGMEIRELEEHKMKLDDGRKRLKEVNEDGENHARAVEQLRGLKEMVTESQAYDHSVEKELLKGIRNAIVVIKEHYDETVEKPKEEIENEMKEEIEGIQEQKANLENLKEKVNVLEGKESVEVIVNIEKEKVMNKIDQRKNEYEQVKEFHTAVLQNEINRFRLNQNVMKGN